MWRHHGRQGRDMRRAAVVGLAAALLGVLIGCSPGRPASGQSSYGMSGPPTAGATPAAAASVRCSARALPPGWTSYRDARYPFYVAAPPMWHTGAFEYVPDGSGLGAASPSYIHVVDFFGPGSPGQAAASGKDRFDGYPPVITIEVGVGQQARIDTFTQNPVFQAQPTPVCIGSTAVTLYAFTGIDGGVEKSALLPKGPHGYPYAFTVASHADTAARDGQLFLTLLATFGPVAGG